MKPNGEARELVRDTSARGNRIALLGNGDGTFPPLGRERYRYAKPVIAAKEDWMVFSTTENVKRSGAGLGSVAVAGAW
ncbi:hypothetical protein KEM55_005838 [Ascosphaera atra]|nr:hypothetical protein KEM55_005838 [Ascosphaera atra]